MKILVVEDETMVSMLLEDMLEMMGHTTVGPVATVAEALDLAASADYDVALLDINLGAGEKAFPIADYLDTRGIPYALVSGYDPSGLDSKYAHATNLQKPFSYPNFSSTVEKLIGRLDQ